MDSLSRRRLLGLGMVSVVLPRLAVTLARADSVGVAKLSQSPPLGDMSIGNSSAKVTMVEYGSTTCHRCAQFNNDTFPQLKKEYIDTGKVRFIFRAFPYDELAMVTFMLLRCAPKDKYFPLIGMLFEQQQKWERNPHGNLFKIFKTTGLSKEKFDACTKDKKLLKGIKEGVLLAEKDLHVNSTPTFFINSKELLGAQPIDKFRAAIDAALKAS